MRIKKSFVQVIGTIWMPKSTAATQYNITASDVEDMGEITRENVDLWLFTHSGDFGAVKDFRADIELPDGSNVVIDWENEDSEFTFNDNMYPDEDSEFTFNDNMYPDEDSEFTFNDNMYPDEDAY